jgi:intracellular sulfur oxidation DsrE/DsrF family protein
MTPKDVSQDLQSNLIPGAVLIPAMVGEVSRLQHRGYSLVFVPAFRP